MSKEKLAAEARKVEWAVNLADQNGDIDYSLAKDVRYLIECINKLDEPEKPVIPKFVADYIEKWEHEGLTIYEWFTFGNNDVDYDVDKWLYNNTIEENRRREYLLIDAIRNGYEVEKEKLYHVIDSNNETLLCKVEGEVMTVAKAWYIGYEQEFYHLTEKEIKDYDERYWAFAEEVTE